MKRPAVFFDRDNTLIACDGYLGDPAKVDLIEGAADAIVRVREMGFAAVVFSNQSGVARGMFPEEAVHAVNHRLDELLHEEDPQAIIDRHDFCPFHPGAKVAKYRVDSELRKPKPGMIYQAERVLNLDLPRSWVVGDAPRDIAAGHAAGLRTVLLKIAGLPPSPATNEGAGVEPDFVAASLKEAVDFIARQSRGDRPAAAETNGHAAWPADEAAEALSPADAVAEADEESPATIAAGLPALVPDPDAPPTESREPEASAAGSGEPPAAAAVMVDDAPADIADAAAAGATPPTSDETTEPAVADAAPATVQEQVPAAAVVAERDEPGDDQPQVVDDAWTIARPSGRPSWAASEPEPSSTPLVATEPPALEATPAAAAEAGETESAVSDPTEGPVKLTPSPTPKPEPAPQPAAAAKPPQGGVVVKPTQAPGLTWGERMRLAKQGGTTVPTVVPTAAPSPRPPVPALAPAAEEPVQPKPSPVVQPQPAARPPAAAAASRPVRPTAVAAVRSAPRPAARVPEVVPEPEPEPVPEPDPVIDVEPEPPPQARPEPIRSEPIRGMRREDRGDADGGPAARAIVRVADDEPTAAGPGRVLIDNRDAAAGPGADLSRVEDLLEQVLIELRRREEQASLDFSVSKLFAGITQVLALAAMFFAYLNKESPQSLQTMLLLAATLQTLTISLLIMGRQK